ncbi:MULTISPECIES: hypothetical protein [unclassified Ensifer]|nr:MULTISPECIES: hypothetical protein [unclassified Ensifer]
MIKIIGTLIALAVVMFALWFALPAHKVPRSQPAPHAIDQTN